VEAIEYEIFVRSVQGAAGDHSSVSRYLRTGTDDRAQGQVSRWTKLHLTRDCTRYRSKYEVQYSTVVSLSPSKWRPCARFMDSRSPNESRPATIEQKHDAELHDGL
jgi:hypothetical protein